MKRTFYMITNYDGFCAVVVKVEAGKSFWLEGYILTKCHSGSPIVERDGLVPDFQDFELGIAELLKDRHILEVSTAKFYAADLLTQERIVAELIKAVVYDVKKER